MKTPIQILEQIVAAGSPHSSACECEQCEAWTAANNYYKSEPDSLELSFQLDECIIKIILAKEKELDYELLLDSKVFLLKTLSNLVRSSAHKFIAGADEHGDDFLVSVDHITEALKEAQDLIFYLSAAKEKLRTFDERYK